MIVAEIGGAGPDWAHVHLHVKNNGNGSYKLGTLTPHVKDLPGLIAGFQRAGWQIEAVGWKEMQDSAGD